MKRYLKVIWNHNFQDEPVWLFSEIDFDRWETRKVELFRDGTYSYADSSNSTGSTRLGEEPIPELESIAEDPQFEPVLIERDEFEAVWKLASENGAKT